MTGYTLSVAILAAATVVSCIKYERLAEPVPTQEPQTQEDPWIPVFSDQAILFRSNSDEPATKTALEADFRIYGFYQPGVIGGDPGEWNPLTCTPNFMYDQEVTYSAGTWSCSPKKYWPNNEENTLSFWAYSPYIGDDDILKLYKSNSLDDYENDVPGIPDMEFTTDGTCDLMVSDLAQDLSYRGGNPADGVVTLEFHHTTSWVDFRVKKVDDSDHYDIVLKSITLENICQTATYDLGGWSAGWNRGSFSAYNCGVGAGTDLDKDEEDRITFPTGGTKLLLIPQALRYTTANLEVVYTMRVHGSGDTPVEYEDNVRLGKITTLWEEGKHYSYYVNISPGNPIQFTAVAVAWDSEQNGYFNVN